MRARQTKLHAAHYRCGGVVHARKTHEYKCGGVVECADGGAVTGAATKPRSDKPTRSGNWIAGAIKKPGALTASAEKAGMSPHAFAEKHKHAAGKTGQRARLALTLSKMK